AFGDVGGAGALDDCHAGLKKLGNEDVVRASASEIEDRRPRVKVGRAIEIARGVNAAGVVQTNSRAAIETASAAGKTESPDEVSCTVQLGYENVPCTRAG